MMVRIGEGIWLQERFTTEVAESTEPDVFDGAREDEVAG
jgi:hypothetical protein